MRAQNYAVCFMFSFMIFLHFLPGSWGSYFNCDLVNEARYCICAETESSLWDIQCPAKIMQVYPMSMKLSISPSDPEEAKLRVICDPDKGEFAWRLIKGLDFEHENVTFSVTSLELAYCPITSTKEFSQFMQQIQVDPLDLHSFIYQTWKANITLPSDFLNIMPNLEVLNLANQGLEHIPNLENLLYLNQLDIRGNSIKDIPTNAFSSSHNLEHIRLSGNSLYKLDNPVFPYALLSLDLVDNRITTITQRAFSNLRNLKGLYLNNNPLDNVDPDALKQLKNLTELSIDHSRLYSFPILQHLPKLTNLSISYSLFSSTQLVTPTSLPDDESQVTDNTENTDSYRVTSTVTVEQTVMTTGMTATVTDNNNEDSVANEDDNISLKGRKDSAFENQHQLIGDLYSLRKLILINDDLKSLSWLGYLPNLTELVVSMNQLKSIQTGFFQNLPSLLYADFSKNSISALSEMDAPHLTYIDLSNNFVRMLDQNYFRQLKQLRVLLLASNKIEYVHPLAFENLESLVILDLSNNRITFEADQPPPMPTQVFQFETERTIMTTVMTTTSSYEEPFDAIQTHPGSPIQFLNKLERLNMKNNLIRKVFMDWTLIPQLKSLDLRHNKVKHLHPRDLYFISEDVRFDVRYNEITDIDMDFAELLLETLNNKNVVVLLDGNPLHCDCQAIPFKNFALKSYHLQYNELRCASPEHLKGKRFIEVSPSDLRCMLSHSCPQSCSCWQLPSESSVKMECKNLNFLSIDNPLQIRSLAEAYEATNVEIEVSNKNLQTISDSIITGITPQIRLLNLTNARLTSFNFFSNLDPFNNVTKFALSGNPFKCDGCKFQKLWWKNFKRIVDIKNITCTKTLSGVNHVPVTITYHDIVRNPICSEDAINDEMKIVVIVFAVVVPIIIAVIACISRAQNCRRRKRRRKSHVRKSDSVVGTLALGSHYSINETTRSKVVDMDNSKF